MDGRSEARMSGRLVSGWKTGRTRTIGIKSLNGSGKKATNYLEGPEPENPMDWLSGGAMMEVVTRCEDRSRFQSFCCETKNSLEVASAGTENYACARALSMGRCVCFRPILGVAAVDTVGQ